MPNLSQHPQERQHGPRWNTLILIGFLAVAGFFLFTEHRAHLFGILPYLLFLACPLMHLFHGHGGHGGHSEATQPASEKPLDDGEDAPRPHQHSH